MLMDVKDTKLLEDIGLTHGETKVYLALLRLGATKTGLLAKEAGVSSSKVYKILDRLIKKGLVGHVLKGKIKHFKALEPKRIIEYMEEKEKQLLTGNMSAWSKILYLEVIDTTFSIDAVLGAFAFTFSIPLILFGNGLGAIIVRQITVGNIERIKKYKYLKNGAMYSILGLGTVMLLDSFGVHIPHWTSPILTIVVIGYFFWRSRKEIDSAAA